MKRLIKGLLAMTTLLLSSCGNEVVLLKRHHVVIFYFNRDNPRETITCDMIDDITGKKYNWEGITILGFLIIICLTTLVGIYLSIVMEEISLFMGH